MTVPSGIQVEVEVLARELAIHHFDATDFNDAVAAVFLEQAASHHPNRIAKIKLNDFIGLAMEYNIRQIPTMLVFQNQKQIAKRIGSVKNVAVILEMIS